MINIKEAKPLNKKIYGSIPHLPGSRRGPADKGLSEQQAKILTYEPRDKHDKIYVEEKLDGSCCGVLKYENKLYPLQRSGFQCKTSPFVVHHYFHHWVHLPQNTRKFLRTLNDGELIIGEWIFLAHGTFYSPSEYYLFEPFVPFDIKNQKGERLLREEFFNRCADLFPLPYLISTECTTINAAKNKLKMNLLYSSDKPEGAVWRVERHGKVDFLGKYVCPDKEDGKYLPEISGEPEILNFSKQILLP